MLEQTYKLQTLRTSELVGIPRFFMLLALRIMSGECALQNYYLNEVQAKCSLLSNGETLSFMQPDIGSYGVGQLLLEYGAHISRDFLPDKHLKMLVLASPKRYTPTKEEAKRSLQTLQTCFIA